MRIAIYSRKSRFTGKGESVENQAEICRAYISARFPETSDKDISVFEDEGFSGKNLNRPRFRQLIETETKNPFDVIVVYRLDRISRSVSDFAGLIDKLNKSKTAFVSVKEQFDTSTPMGRAMMNIAAVFAQLERETIAERVKDNMYMLARTGRWLGGTAPLGFGSEKSCCTDDRGVTRKCSILAEDPAQTGTVKTIYEKFIEYRSIKKVEAYLLERGIKTRSGCRFYTATIRSVLKNPVYCTADERSYDYFAAQGCAVAALKEECCGSRGFIGYSKTAAGSEGERVTNGKGSWIIAVGRHRGIISSADWIKAQNILEENSSGNPAAVRARNAEALLTGLLFCACGGHMRPKYYRKNKNGAKPYVYMCSIKERDGKKKCACPNLSGKTADKLICDILLNFALPEKTAAEYPEKFRSAEEALAFFRENFDSLSVPRKREFISRCVKKAVWDGASLQIFLNGAD